MIACILLLIYIASGCHLLSNSIILPMFANVWSMVFDWIAYSLWYHCFFFLLLHPLTFNHTDCASFFNRSYSKKIADLIFNELIIECKLWEELATVVCHFRSGEMFDPCNKRVILQIGRVCILISQLYMLQAMCILKIFSSFCFDEIISPLLINHIFYI